MSYSRIGLVALFVPLVASCTSPTTVNCPTGVVCPAGMHCAVGSAVCIAALCGDEVVDPDEACDNGTNPVTGNVASDGPAGSCPTQTCSTTCQKLECGNKIVDTCKGEACDDGADSATCNGPLGQVVGAECQPSRCGDNYVNAAAGEECDANSGQDTSDCNGNSTDARTVSAECQPSKCGDNYVNAVAGEKCDANSGQDTADCNGDSDLAQHVTAQCQPAQCGDGYLNQAAGEKCDTGGPDTTDCNGNTQAAISQGVQCHIAACGDHYVNGASNEKCDDGADNAPSELSCPTQHCSHDCTSDLTCGNGIVDKCKGEICDLGALNGVAGSGCSADCMSYGKCGDGAVDPGEDCDPGRDDQLSQTCNEATCPSQTAQCNRNCKRPVCGDGWVNPAANEQCDDGRDSVTCNGPNALAAVQCQLSRCGDGYVNMAAGEECDGGPGGAPVPSCTVSCSTTLNCGQDYCATDSCTQSSSCADGIDAHLCTNGSSDLTKCGNTIFCNGSLAGALSCKISYCGDSYVNAAAGETCEPDQTAWNANKDTSRCNGPNAPSAVQCHASVCGDGYVNAAAGETCDAGRDATGNLLPGCNKNCTGVASGYSCTQPAAGGPSVCRDICGDGNPAGEVCDDHNTLACGTCNNANGCQNATTATLTAATGTITSVAAGSAYTDHETFTLSDGWHALIFEFSNSTVTSGNVPISIAATATAMTCNICKAINGSGLSITVDCSSCNTNNVFTLTNAIAGAVGNVQMATTAPSTAFIATGMSGGAAGDCAGGVGCNQGADCASSICTASVCAAPSCTDGVKNGFETDSDCGGNCSLSGKSCADGSGCIIGSDCASGVCNSTLTKPSGNGKCAPASCADGVKNGNETDVDCGGGPFKGNAACPPCGSGLACSVPTPSTDCASKVCSGGRCVAGTCDDKVQNSGETGVDCGGSCTPCNDGIGCNVNSDCQSHSCAANKLCATSCSDNVKNGNETDIDCGGGVYTSNGTNVGPCPSCRNGFVCSQSSDCQSSICVSIGGRLTCEATSCFDGVKDFDETGTDCGGSCAPCADGGGCNGNSDCQSRSCGANKVCATTCADGVKNGNETDVDCGGGPFEGNAACRPCANGLVCAVSGDCTSRLCVTLAGGLTICAATTCADGVKDGNETDVDCGGSCAPCGNNAVCSAPCGNNAVCNVPAYCVSNVCTGGRCVAPSCSDGVKNGNESGVDCGGASNGSHCVACAPGQGCTQNSDCQPPTIDSNVSTTTTTGICDTTQRICVGAQLLRVTVNGNDTVSSSTSGFSTGDIVCAQGQTCIEALPVGATVTLTATSTATSGNIMWSVPRCDSCSVGDPSDGGTTSCSCTFALSPDSSDMSAGSNVSVTVTTP